MPQKKFILQAALGGLVEVDPANKHVYHPDAGGLDLVLSPAAVNTPPAPRFTCSKPELASLAKSKRYK